MSVTPAGREDPAMRSKTKLFGISLLAVLTLCLSAAAGAQAPSEGQVNLTGEWKGTRTTTGLGAGDYKIRSIKFDLTQTGKAIAGSYQCYTGKKSTADCSDPVGKITDGSINGDKFKIDVQTLPDNMNCIFEGSVSCVKMNGRYSCFVAGSVSSIGIWNAYRP